MDKSPETMQNFSTFVELLRHHAQHQPHKIAFTFLQDGETESDQLTYQQLDRQARAIAAKLQSLGLEDERALLLYSPNLAFLAAFFGCLYARTIPIPAYPPRPNRSMKRLESILIDSKAAVALTNTAILTNLERRFANHEHLKALHWLTTDNLNHELAASWLEPDLATDTLALLQYTSGSTAAPKGVMISHTNLLHNSALINHCFQHSPDSYGVSWLPPYHDMGLIGGILQPVYVGASMVLMPPVAFLQKPFRWLQAISRYQATTSGGPNFAYDLCLNKTTPEQRQALDLSHWHLAFSGAEPINSETLDQFSATFEPYGFRRQAFFPCYGLAEATLLVTGRSMDAPMVQKVDSTALGQNQIIPLMEDSPNSHTLVSCGQPPPNQSVAIVDPETEQPCPTDQIGEIWVAGSDSIAQGYWNRPEQTEQTFQATLAETGIGPFMRTGDLGFIHQDQLFVTGRIKDLIIIRGRNYYPTDIEQTVERSHPDLRSGCGAAFSVNLGGTECLVVAYELERSALRNLKVDEIITAIRRSISEHHDLQVSAILLLKTGSIPKTSSGKIQRYACRTGFLDHHLDIVGSWQVQTNGHNPLYRSPAVHPSPTKNSELPSQAKDQQPSQTVAPSAGSRERADQLIGWLGTYANQRVNSRLIDERRSIPPYIVLDFGNQGALGMQVPEQYGGLGLNNTDMMRVMEQLGAIDPTLSLFVGLNNVLGIRPILNYATPTLREELLPVLATGRELAAFALTEPGAGSNPQAIAGRAVADGPNRWRLHGTKIWSGSAAWAGVINVFVQQLNPQGQATGMSGFVVRQGTEGLRQGPEALTMGMRGMIQNTIYFEGVPVGAENVLGGDLGAGMTVAQDAMMYGRLTIGASSVGGMKRCAQLMLRYATVRSVATGRLLDNPVTLARLSDLTAAITAVETLIYRITKLLDGGHTVPVDAYVVCKMAGPEFLWQAADHLVQLLGGRGYIEPNLAPQILRDARILRIFEGPTETLTMFLGSRVANKSAELTTFLDQVLGAPLIGERLRAAAAEIDARCSGSAQPFGERSSALRWAYTLIGQVALYAVLWAAVEADYRQSPTDELKRAAEWTRLQFEQTLARALKGTPMESVLLNANATTDLVSSYTETIGDLEQTLAGEDHDLDALLRQQQDRQTSSSKGASITSTASSQPRPSTHGSGSPATAAVESNGIQAANRQSAAAIQQFMVDWLVQALKIPADSIDTTKAFADYGLDSVTAVELADALQDWLGCVLSPTVAYEYPTIESLSLYLAADSGSTNGYSEELQPSQGDDEVEQLLSALEDLSEAETQQLLGNAN